ncbi:Poly(A) polymerase central domain-containing protein [Cantharellus anzutake]|uniref:Poly(A) polymerase central domain-containing protein n=1 Tax=Cantharellus anzutake TaxID=1750568 RepID=UPI001905321D|nr:Poly(A) polymerase central domain-containing protein [Cantharellus anzutake]KAF8341454.1 Poly(A) polymerase central domain-containing protein [Cantharellus anzutake]
MTCDRQHPFLSFLHTLFVMSTITQQYGVTPPISTAGPTQREIEVTESLKQELIGRNSYESQEESKLREITLGRIAVLVRKFVHDVMIERGLSETMASTAGGKIFTFGSYRLGVHGPGTDIDTLCVVPKHIEREDFFTHFEPMLRAFEGATDVAGVPEAYVPIITANISGVAFDFLFARLAMSSIPDDLELKDDNLLRNLDERCVRSLGGSRVTDQILRLVPNVSVFRDALRCIKLWAQKRAIYSNVNGFLGGVAWAMLVARICQLYPNANAGAIVSRFFIIMYQWQWPSPVLLKPIEDGPLQVRVWNPKLYPSDRAHRMPIVTPAYPAMCSTHNVTQSTQAIMNQEFKRGADIVDRVMIGTAEWTELFQKHDFFHRYHNYLRVIASTGDSATQLKWSGTVESRIRQLIMKLEFVDGVTVAHPFTKSFDATFYCKNDAESDAIVQGDVPSDVAKRTLDDVKDVPAHRTVCTSTFYVGLGLRPKQSGTPGARKLDISYPANEFVKMAKSWEHFDASTMSIVVRHLKRWDFVILGWAH